MIYIRGYAVAMADVGMRELRQNPAPVLRAVEGGEEVTVSVNGRPVARIVPLQTPAWVDGSRAQSVYRTSVDPEWEADFLAARRDDAVDDPWS